MINLFEYQNKVDIQDSFEGLEGFLDEIWNSRKKNSFYSENGNDKIESQRFLQFIHKSNELKSNNKFNKYLLRQHVIIGIIV